MKEIENYYIGLDIGTGSVGYAVTDENYNLIKHKNEAMWGSHVFEAGQQAAERRQHRIQRRLIARRKHRVQLTRELFAKEIAKIDENFYKRLDESALYPEDKSSHEIFSIFNDKNHTDAIYNKKYPTIHHLICDLMTSEDSHDVRLVYIAVSWLVKHRGHFLNEVNPDKIDSILDFDLLYSSFMMLFDEEKPWECDVKNLKDVLKKNLSVTAKERELLEILYNGKKPKTDEDDVFSKSAIVKLISGGTVKINELFNDEAASEENESICFKSPEKLEEVLPKLTDDRAEFLTRLWKLFDWSLLSNILIDSNSISEAKVKVYEQHKKDLCFLKQFFKKYMPDKYEHFFKCGGKDRVANYVNYSYNIKSLKGERPKKVTQAAFCDYLKGLVKNINVSEQDALYSGFVDMKSRLEAYYFMPKQVNTDNRVIPYQLYYHELKMILEKASLYLPFLSEAGDGLTTTGKLLKILEFRIPYFVGPLSKKSPHAWLKREDGKIYPWNFESKVDLDASEVAFIKRMTNKCTYLPDEDVLAKNSLLYSKFTVLNEINNLQINGLPISVELKQKVYTELFEKKKKVSVKMISDLLKSEGAIQGDDLISGIDTTVKSSLRSFHDFKNMLRQGMLTDLQVEEIIERLTYSEDRRRIKKWLNDKFSFLSEEDINYISKLKYNDFGRLSRAFLSEITGVCKEAGTGECCSIIEMLWETNDNIMQLRTDKYTFLEELRKRNNTENKVLEELLDDMYVSNAVKRPIYRTLDIVKDIVKVTKKAPTKIFVEMARGGGEKGKRTKSRRDSILELYSSIGKENSVIELKKQLGSITDNQLQKDSLFLYFTQLGKCMYSNTVLDILDILDIERFNSSDYDIDHIYPQSLVKDDSIHNNKVLVLKTLNGEKSNNLLKPEIRAKMSGFWAYLKEKGLINEEKYKRLMRKHAFSEEEKMGFINRQLVETRQSTKAIAAVFNAIYPDTEIIYVKAGLVSDFRHQYELLKCRDVNDLHHAKDAFLNIVCGNVYSSRFSKKFFNINSEYSLKTENIFRNPVSCGNKKVWRGQDSIALIKGIMRKNNIHYTRFAFCRKGGLFDQMPVRKSEGLVAIKKGLDTSKYGGYRKPTASCFLMTKFCLKKKTDIIILPIELMNEKIIFNDSNDMQLTLEFVAQTLADILGKEKSEINNISFPLGLRRIRVNTLLSLDGYLACISGKANGGKVISLSNMVPLILPSELELYCKKLSAFAEKRAKNSNINLDAQYDGITADENIKLYDLFLSKLSETVYKNAVFANQEKILKEGRTVFEQLPLEKQSELLLQILIIFNGSDADLSEVKGSKKAGVQTINTTISNWKKKYKNVYIIDISPSGLFKSMSKNLLELL